MKRTAIICLTVVVLACFATVIYVNRHPEPVEAVSVTAETKPAPKPKEPEFVVINGEEIPLPVVWIRKHRQLALGESGFTGGQTISTDPLRRPDEIPADSVDVSDDHRASPFRCENVYDSISLCTNGTGAKVDVSSFLAELPLAKNEDVVFHPELRCEQVCVDRNGNAISKPSKEIIRWRERNCFYNGPGLYTCVWASSKFH